ncbi:MAG: hypothetical protein M1824_006303 [Vezdaea acicularis]|nr:MAG: hypothetical protein M1824_006303 [Vezdaea acicularis]
MSYNRSIADDDDGWGDDAPQVTRSELEKVPTAYRPTKVNMSALMNSKPETSRSEPNTVPYLPSTKNEGEGEGDKEVIKGVYQPIGKVDIAAIRRQAQSSSTGADDRPTVTKGAYEPVGKVDIAAIRARAQPRPSNDGTSQPSSTSPAITGRSGQTADNEGTPKSLAERSNAFIQSERLTSLPKPKVAKKFSGASSFTGTTAPLPGAFGLVSKPTPASPAVGAASRTFADQGGKTPAQIWAEKKARERGVSGASDNPPSGISASPINPQTSGGGEWKSGYSGKSWAPVQTTRTGQSATSSIGQQRTGEQEPQQDEAPSSPAGGISAIRDRFKGAPPMGAPPMSATPSGNRSAPSPPPLDTASKPNAGGRAIPGLPIRGAAPVDQDEDPARSIPTPPIVPRSPTPPTPTLRSSSPIRVAMPVSRGSEAAAPVSPPVERLSSPPVPANAMARGIPHEDDLTEEPTGHEPARGAGAAAAAATFGHTHEAVAPTGDAGVGGKKAIVHYDYEKAEDNEIELVEGQYVTNIDMVDTDWWMGTNSKGDTGLFPSNYVELVEHEEEPTPAPQASHQAAAPPLTAPAAATSKSNGVTATALYDYEAAEENELAFPDGAKITEVEFPDEDWWMGVYKGKQGLFPANYVQLDD